MRIFDAHIRSDTRSEDDLRNLHYFETTHVVTAAHARRKFERASDLISYLDSLTQNEVSRLRSCGFEAYVALGVPPNARPRRSHYEVWSALPDLLSREAVVAVGEVSANRDHAEHWELFERQVEMARDAGLALIATPPARLRANMTYKMMQRLDALGFPRHKAMMTHLDERLVETVVAEGFVAGVSAGPYHLEPRQAARVVAESIQYLGHCERIVLNSALREGAADILGIPKTVAELQELGTSDEVVSQIAFDNAARLFEISAE